MIGNDVVDLKLAHLHSKWNKDSFQEKVLHPRELEKFKDKALNFQQFWKIWSCKETAYKAHQREFKLKPSINPSQFYVNEINETQSEVKVNQSIYKVESLIQENYIYTFTQTIDYFSIQNFKVDKPGHQYAYNLNRNHFNSIIEKDGNGIPDLKVNFKKYPVSITHHGNFLAFLVFKNARHLFKEYFA